MKLYLFRHGKSDKSLKESLSHDEFELKRELLPGETEKAIKLGSKIRNELGQLENHKIDVVFSGKMRSKQTVTALAQGMGLERQEIESTIREDFGLIYLASEQYWTDCSAALKNSRVSSHADYFLSHEPDSNLTFGAEYMRESMRQVIRRAINRNIFLKNDMSIMVSHEPVISLCMSDIFEKSVTDLGGSCSELEYAEFEVKVTDENVESIVVKYRDHSVDCKEKIY